ncbi:unnamed protein product [Nippostrongylus brasiliensis]|uniref:L-fucose kinase (inferred by orthology to a human protein) n=1 Tax=Nippostrongylus brasiliensis TaxID=27835 RepID=A0A158QZG5_NIPBR|nr:unnamed protein product [Nippostrongylus brasiliensis]
MDCAVPLGHAIDHQHTMPSQLVAGEFTFLRECGLFETNNLLVVSDPCDDVGSAGSALNALLIASIVTSLRYRCCPPDDNPNVLLALLYLPPSVSTRFLSLHSVYPISRSTYYGTDSGALGLKLSLFFDVVLATCLGEEEFVASQTATEKSDMNHDVLAQSRRAIWNRFHQLKCRAYCLPLSHYEYLGGDVNMEFSADQEDVICYLEKQVLRRLSAVIVDDEHHCNSIAPLRTLMAISRNYENVIVDVLEELESTRHFEAAAQICTRIEVERMCRKHFNAISNTVRGPVQPRVTVECAARKPISCHIRHGSDAGITVKTGETMVYFHTASEIFESCSRPGNPGLGTSSILAAAIIKALGVASAQEYTPKAICHAVLMVEQLLTTGGGWQDQVGCLYPGLKKGIMPCELVETYYKAKKQLASGCEPAMVASLIDGLKRLELN